MLLSANVFFFYNMIFTLLQEFSPDIAVTLDDWVGMTHEVKSMLTMRTMDGSLCTMYDHQAMDLKGVNDKHSRVIIY